jgi:hypothetical protein
MTKKRLRRCFERVGCYYWGVAVRWVQRRGSLFVCRRVGGLIKSLGVSTFSSDPKDGVFLNVYILDHHDKQRSKREEKQRKETERKKRKGNVYKSSV